MLNILLTSYNRQHLLKRALESLQAQTNQNWRCYLLDDNSNEETQEIIASFKDEKRIIPILHKTTEKERKEKSRYAALINEQLPKLKKGVVGYLCDNVEYSENLVESVLGYFDKNKESFACFVVQHRDVLDFESGKRLGYASDFGHWNVIPPAEMWKPLSGNVKGFLDHSQVFHRLPVDLTWSESLDHIKFGDAEFYTRLNEKYGEIGFNPRASTLEHIPS